MVQMQSPFWEQQLGQHPIVVSSWEVTLCSTLQLLFKIPEIPSTREHKALPTATVGGAGSCDLRLLRLPAHVELQH